MSLNFKHFIPYFSSHKVAFYAVISQNSGTANSADTDQTAPSGAVRSSQICICICLHLSKALVYEILGNLP